MSLIKDCYVSFFIHLRKSGSQNLFSCFQFRDTALSHNTTSEQLTDLQKKFPGTFYTLRISLPSAILGYLSLSGNVPLTLLVVLTVIFGWKFNLKKRLILTAFGELVSFGVIAVAAGVETDEWQDR